MEWTTGTTTASFYADSARTLQLQWSLLVRETSVTASTFLRTSYGGQILAM